MASTVCIIVKQRNIRFKFVFWLRFSKPFHWCLSNINRRSTNKQYFKFQNTLYFQENRCFFNMKEVDIFQSSLFHASNAFSFLRSKVVSSNILGGKKKTKTSLLFSFYQSWVSSRESWIMVLQMLFFRLGSLLGR